jgi:FKBP-type peptidyl-prolyl cis-trans isomerase
MPGDLIMKNRRFFYLIAHIVIISVFSAACRSGNDNKSTAYKPSKNDMADLNNYLIQKDRERIQSYFERKNLAMQETSTGLWYSILKEGNGSFFIYNDIIRYEYDCSLLDGTKCYSSQELGVAEIQIGISRELPAGLYEGVKLLKRGGEAVFILPPFLAYGFVGDGKKIPPRATLVYSIRILE